MTLVASTGYTFGSTELVTNAKLHSLVDSATFTGSRTYSLSFTSGSLVSYLFSIPHSLNDRISKVHFWYTDESEQTPNAITYQDANNILLDLTSYASFASVCTVKVMP